MLGTSSRSSTSRTATSALLCLNVPPLLTRDSKSLLVVVDIANILIIKFIVVIVIIVARRMTTELYFETVAKRARRTVVTALINIRISNREF